MAGKVDKKTATKELYAPKKQMWLGAAYYPEMWDESEVDKDIEHCKSLGLNVMRVGEFAWGKMEPREGEFDFGWLLSVVDKLYANGIYTVMCTPTCTPPRWMLDKYEETRRVKPSGERQDVSSRIHPCKTSPLMREKNKIIVTEMAKVFGSHKGIIGWQIDNEQYPYDLCYCPQCIAAFRERLKKRFGTIDKLNKAWGMTRWSLEYGSFDDIKPPYPDQWKHPSLQKAWWDFHAAQVVSFSDEQADILHKYTKAPVGTDMMPNIDFDLYSLSKKLDVAMLNHYDTADRLYVTAIWYDFMRSMYNKPFWVTETQVGWNGGVVADNGYRPVGNCYANTWLPIALGGEMNMYWLFRSHPNGHELAHGSLLSACGREYRVSDEVRRAGRDFVKCNDFLTNTEIKSDIAITFSTTAAVDFMCAPILKDFDYRQTMTDIHAAFRHYNTDVIDTAHSLDGYKVLVTPFAATLDENGFIERVKKWIEDGGTWIVGPMSDIYDGDVTKYSHAPYSFLEELVGVYTKYQKPVGNDVFKAKWTLDRKDPCGLSMCYDAYEPVADTAVDAAVYDGGEFDGLAAIAYRQVGKGWVILLGSRIENKDLLYLAAMKPIADASDNIILSERIGNGINGIIAVEVENKDGYVILNGEYLELISGKRCGGKYKMTPYAVAVFQRLNDTAADREKPE